MTTHRLALPAPGPVVRAAYSELVADLDDRISRLIISRFPGILKCKAGCDSCCIRFSVLPLEAALVAEARRSLAITKETGSKMCSLLAEGCCLVYQARPIICRTQGLPLGYVDELTGTIEVSACHLNFTEEYPLAFDDLLLMDEFNLRLAELNVLYCRDAQIDPGKRILLEACCSA